MKFEATPREYFLFKFEGMPVKRRGEFLTAMHVDKMEIKHQKSEHHELLGNKHKFASFYKGFTHRECIEFNPDDKEVLKEFYNRHTALMVKPISESCGKGIFRVDTKEKDFNEFFEECKSIGKCVIEEYIIQDPSIAAFNLSSVNTVRLCTFLYNNQFIVLKPIFRLGRAGAVVDNARRGGFFGVVDEKSGIVVTDGHNANGETFVVHPDSKKPIKGFQIPRWNELLQMAEKMHRMLPDCKYIGWDFCLTKDGWAVIEGNWGQFGSEYGDWTGIKHQFDKYIGETE